MKVKVYIPVDDASISVEHLFGDDATQENYDTVKNIVASLLDDDEFITIEIDTETKTASIVPTKLPQP